MEKETLFQLFLSRKMLTIIKNPHKYCQATLMGMVHCYRCSLPGHYAVLRNLYLLYLLTVTLYILYVKELPFSTFHL